MIYVLHPGWVTSRTDGDRHYITAGQLAKLYGVPMSRCIIVREGGPSALAWGHNARDLIHLYPRASGNYALPEGCGRVELETTND